MPLLVGLGFGLHGLDGWAKEMDYPLVEKIGHKRLLDSCRLQPQRGFFSSKNWGVFSVLMQAWKMWDKAPKPPRFHGAMRRGTLNWIWNEIILRHRQRIILVIPQVLVHCRANLRPRQGLGVTYHIRLSLCDYGFRGSIGFPMTTH